MIDDGSHRYLDQDATLHTLWPRVREGGFYVIEDVVVGALPWASCWCRRKGVGYAGLCGLAGRQSRKPYLGGNSSRTPTRTLRPTLGACIAAQPQGGFIAHGPFWHA